jgi:hypothetical protein
MGFYKVFGDYVVYAPTSVSTPEGNELRIEEAATYTYPIDGWYYFASPLDASQAFNLPVEIEGVVTYLAENWNQFNALMLFDQAYNGYLATVRQILPALEGALPAALVQVVDKGIESFSLVYQAFCQVAGVTQEDKDRWKQFAISSRLRQEFVDLL